MAGKLTDRQRRFADAYLEYGNATKAAYQAGFCPSYAQGAMRQPAVKAYLEERRRQMPVKSSEVINFLVGVMRGNIKASQLRTDAAVQVGIRAGLWNNAEQAQKVIEEAAQHE